MRFFRNLGCSFFLSLRTQRTHTKRRNSGVLLHQHEEENHDVGKKRQPPKSNKSRAQRSKKKRQNTHAIVEHGLCGDNAWNFLFVFLLSIHE